MFVGKVIGGLANQMFQVSFYSWLAKKHNVNFFIDVSEFKNYGLHNGFELTSVFDLSLNFSEHLNSKTKYPRLHKVERKFLKRSFIFGKRHFFELDLLDNNIALKDDFYIEGYFQDIKYVNKDFFQFREFSLLPHEVEIFNSNQEVVSIHVRGGDFLSKENQALYGGICTKQYYHEALSFFDGKSCLFLVFTDDECHAKMILPDDRDYIFVDWNLGEKAYRDMILMKSCDHNIISNSTFAWWGAFLNNNNGMIVSPEKWNNIDNGLFDNLWQPSWIKV